MDENGVCPIGDDGTDKMISYNHYASGAVGDFLYRRIAGIEPTEAGYKAFRVKPILGGGLTSAFAKVRTPYGDASVQWETAADTFTVTVCVGRHALRTDIAGWHEPNTGERHAHGDVQHPLIWSKYHRARNALKAGNFGHFRFQKMLLNFSNF